MLRLRIRSEGKHYSLLVARALYHATPETDQVLRAYSDPLAQALNHALIVALPQATRGEIVWVYQFALGAVARHQRHARRTPVQWRQYTRRPGRWNPVGQNHRGWHTRRARAVRCFT